MKIRDKLVIQFVINYIALIIFSNISTTGERFWPHFFYYYNRVSTSRYLSAIEFGHGRSWQVFSCLDGRICIITKMARLDLSFIWASRFGKIHFDLLLTFVSTLESFPPLPQFAAAAAGEPRVETEVNSSSVSDKWFEINKLIS